MTIQESYKAEQVKNHITCGAEQTERKLRSHNLLSTLHLVREVSERLHRFKEQVGSMPRPCNEKVCDSQVINPSNLVDVVANLRNEVEQVCADMLIAIDDLEEDLLNTGE